mmetsp:Transcript_17060/g.25829  ORF Transcript_17060/g.25829 Transcript_17060/m.25829 type:complete len:336 (-) Transcript_17060:53-1060(-)
MSCKPLPINISLINGPMDEEDAAQELGMMSTYRQEDFSIGRDFLRVKGDTLFKIHPSSIKMENTIGRGAFSRVIKANYEKDKTVALKQFPLNCETRQEMLAKELKALIDVDCECLVKFLGAFFEMNIVTLVLEYMDRGTLNTILESGVALPNYTAAAATFQMLWGLAYLHFEACLHRDIKPDNILVHSDGSVKLSDFGISSNSKMNTTFIGTTKYMALERLRAKKYGPPSDVWSLGLVILHCVTGSFLFEDVESLLDLVITLEEQEEGGSLVPSEVENEYCRQVVEGCLQIKPEKRVPSSIMLRSPWFENANIKCVDDAKAEIKDFLLKQNYKES